MESNHDDTYQAGYLHQTAATRLLYEHYLMRVVFWKSRRDYFLFRISFTNASAILLAEDLLYPFLTRDTVIRLIARDGSLRAIEAVSRDTLIMSVPLTCISTDHRSRWLTRY